ncbi:MAG TPA: hypothetical protein VM386_00875, partial [Acidimicrobiales bacterium]|nr:hypothetical protein [Acidimicrobiales bacterium]
LGAGTRLWGARRLVSMVDLITLPVIRRSIHTALGVGLVGTSVAGVAGTTGIDRTARSGVMSFELVVATVATEAGAGTSTMPDDGADGDPPVMQLLPDEVPAHPVPAVPTGGLTESEWEVRSGDHLWSVAEHVLEHGGADSTSDAAVAEYWRRLIAANTDRLADPGNPDLLFPGQVLTLPSPLPVGEGALP